MQLTPRYLLTQFAHALQQSLFSLETELGPLSPQLKRIAAIMALLPLERLLSARRASTGRPAEDRAALATAFIAKAVLNTPTTRSLLAILRADEALRRLCGWRDAKSVPSEATFSRAFEEFAQGELPQHLHAAVVATLQQDRIVLHIARDSTAIPVRERLPEQPAAPKKAKKKAKSKPKQKRAKAAERGTRIQRQGHQTLAQMLKDLPRGCDIGAKKNSKGHEQYWRGYKLHLDVADGQVPISAVLTSASVHDSQVAIPLMTITSQRVKYLYDVMDSAYDADALLDYSRKLEHVPVVQPHGRRGTKKSLQMQKVFPDKPTPQLCPAKQERYKTRTMIERVNARLKDEFGASQIRVRGAAKVMAHLMFGVLALTVDQWLRIAAPS